MMTIIIFYALLDIIFNNHGCLMYDSTDLESLSPFCYNMFGVVKWMVNQFCGLLIMGVPLMYRFSSLSSDGVR